MANLNKVFLIGRLTHDPELRYTAGGSPVTDLRLATNRIFQGKDGERKEDTLFIDVTVWNRTAENCAQYLKKGRQVHIEGYLKQESWEDKATGAPRSKIKVEAERVQFLDGNRPSEGGGSDFGGEEDFAPPAREPRRAAPEPRGGNGPHRGGYGAPSPAPAPPRRPAAPPPDSESDDDIPF